MAGYNTLDTRAFDKFISSQLSLLTEYNTLSEEYDSIVKTLLDNWKGHGADAFLEDAQKVKSNITGIQDILKTMCDTLIDCRAIFSECDVSLGRVNREAIKSK